MDMCFESSMGGTKVADGRRESSRDAESRHESTTVYESRRQSTRVGETTREFHSYCRLTTSKLFTKILARSLVERYSRFFIEHESARESDFKKKQQQQQKQTNKQTNKPQLLSFARK